MLNPGGAIMSLSELAKMDGLSKDIVKEATASTLGTTVLVGLLVAIGIGVLIGFINGISVGVFRMTPFIVTLATQLLARGVAMVVSGGYSIPGTPSELTRMSYATGIQLGEGLVIPWVIVILVGIILIFGLLLGKTTWGRSIALVGSNSQSAKYVGINVPFVLSSVYVIAGLLAGMAGFITMMCLGTADPKVGDPMLITIIGSVILGGVDMNGGEGSMTKAALGMFLFATLINGMTFLNLTLALQQIVQGAILVVGMTLLARIKLKR
jgi:ribose/xylose/arabinose/galactoside ABC-type transport system permease subunit